MTTKCCNYLILILISIPSAAREISIWIVWCKNLQFPEHYFEDDDHRVAFEPLYQALSDANWPAVVDKELGSHQSSGANLCRTAPEPDSLINEEVRADV